MTPTPRPGVRRIGMFGGAFDPPHCAHQALARAAVEQLGLDTLYVIPTGHAWHKPRALSAPKHRLAMAQLAFDGLPQVKVDDREMRRAGPSYTADTLAALQGEHPGAQLYLLMGADQFAVFGQWQRSGEIRDIAIICIADRSGAASDSTESLQSSQLSSDRQSAVLTLNLPLMHVSATQIRELVAASGALAPKAPDLSGLVPEPVARYIAAHRLYQTQG
ncbi:nicotinate (nicotinamide) nucleotide adenylyltransferase [Polaromonas sp. YR568]|uniref:nicotinate (nicotinamide) nucleotide adenylyltransferase n=1 Tax=Polaromonas sp. YR568 TaxID=1855301 RepID=UPI003137E74A